MRRRVAQRDALHANKELREFLESPSPPAQAMNVQRTSSCSLCVKRAAKLIEIAHSDA